MSLETKRQAKICRREVLLPGELLPAEHACPGKHPGTVIKVVAGQGGYSAQAVVAMADILLGKYRNKHLKVTVPLDKVLPHLLPKKERPKADSLRFESKREAPAPSAKHSPPPRKKRRPAGEAPLRGPALADHMKTLEAVASARYPPGTRVWVRVPGSGRWPGVSWRFGLCKRRDMGQLITSYRPGLVVVRFYGEHSNMWVREEDCEQPPEDETDLVRQFKSWGRQHNKMRLVDLALDEVVGAHADPAQELRRMLMLYDQYLQARQALDNCYLCRELGAKLSCTVCDRLFHPLCLLEPAVSEEELLEGCGGRWACPCCGEDNVLGEEQEEEEGDEEGEKAERMGLTPDWLIEAAAFHVFELERPHARRPFIPRLLDPCTNSKLAPNIPAEKLYDKRDNGLKLSNSWAGGYYVLLNPPFTAQVQWRFVNRCIDEVENGEVPAAILICRNSTDTAYFQRLRPYPRVLLRRMSARFKDYDKTPIGFGIAVFCIANKSNCRELYERFYDSFHTMGEPNVPVDRTFIQSEQYYELLERLKGYAAEHERDHWVQCYKCEKWRIVDYATALQLGEDDEWECALLKPPHTSCDTPLSYRERIGGRYAAGGVDFDLRAVEEEGRESEGEGEVAQEPGVEEATASGGEPGTPEAAGAAAAGAAAEADSLAGQAGAAAPGAPGAAQGSGGAALGQARPLLPLQLLAWRPATPQQASGGSGSVGGVRPAFQLPAGIPWPLPPAAWQIPALRPVLAAAAAAAAAAAGRPPAMPGSAAGQQQQLGSAAASATGAAGSVLTMAGAGPGALAGGSATRPPLLLPLPIPPLGMLPPGLRLPPDVMLPPFFPIQLPPGAGPPQLAPMAGASCAPAAVTAPQAALAQGSPAMPTSPTAFLQPAAVPGQAAEEGRALAQSSQQESQGEGASPGSRQAGPGAMDCDRQGAGEAAKAEGEAGAVKPEPGAPGARAARPAPPPLPSPLPPAAEVVCERTLRELIMLPPRNNITLDREGDPEQVLTALELARQARIAANRAYLAGLGLGPNAVHTGTVPPLEPNDPVMLQAARELAMQAAAEEARRQLDRMRQRYEAARRRRARLEPQLLAQLKELRDEESEAQRELAFAEAAVQELGPVNADVSAEGAEESEVEDEEGEENEQQDLGCRTAALEACASGEVGEEMAACS